MPHRDVVTTEGIQLTMINPAFMTRQISELAKKKGGLQFHITSLNPIRPENRASGWEIQSLKSFEKGEEETGGFIKASKSYRYMAPLFTTQACLKCHATQGYEIGDIRGGISITQPAGELLDHQDHSIFIIMLTHMLMLMIGYFVIRFYAHHQHHLQELRVEKEIASRSNAFKNAFIANISHEFRTPLNAVVSMSEMLADQSSGEHKQHLQLINQAGRQLDVMVSRILGFTKIASGELTLHIAPHELRHVIEESVGLMQERASEKGLSLIMEFAPDVSHRFLFDATILEEILFHLIENAIKFTSEGKIVVGVSGQAQNNNFYGINISIVDTGIGISESPEWLDRHDFTQVDEYLTRSSSGLGVGLTLTRKLLELIGGTMQLKSEPGHGTEILISLSLERVKDDVVSKPVVNADILEGVIKQDSTAEKRIDLTGLTPEMLSELEVVAIKIRDLLEIGDVSINQLVQEVRPQLDQLGSVSHEIEDLVNEFNYPKAKQTIQDVLNILQQAKHN